MYFSFSETEARLNLGVWTPPGSHNAPPEIKQVGELWMGRFGFFVPKQFLKSDTPMMSYTFLQDNHNAMFDQFVFGAPLLNEIQSLAEYVLLILVLRANILLIICLLNYLQS